VLGDLGRDEEALAAFEKAVELDSENASNWSLKGEALAGLGRDEEALAAFEKAVALDPDDAKTWWWKGLCLANLGRHEEALVAFEEASELDPDNADTWWWKGNALSTLGRHEEALAAFEEASELDPDNADTWCLKGNALAGLGRDEEALAAFEKAVELDPDNADTWCLKGNALAGLGRDEKALAAFEKAIELDLDNNDNWWLNGQALASLGRHEEALAAFEKAVELDPDDANNWRSKGDTLASLGRHAEAVAAFDKAFSLAPTFANLQARGHARKALGRYAEARASFREISGRPCAILGEIRTKHVGGGHFLYDPELPGDRLPNCHIMITGETGSGKTQAIKVLLAELEQFYIPPLVLDFKDDYSDATFAAREHLAVCDPNADSLPFNPLVPGVDPLNGYINPLHHIHQLTEIIKRVYHLGDQQAFRLREAIKRTYEEAAIPLESFVPDSSEEWPQFDSIRDQLAGRQGSNELLGRLSVIFDLHLFSSEADVADFAGAVANGTVIRLARLPGDEVKNSVAEFFLMALYNYLVRQPQSHELSRLLVLDEAWRLVKSPYMDPLMREGRAFGLGIVIASQFPMDLPTTVSGSTATKLYFSQTNIEQVRAVQRTVLGNTSGPEADRLARVMRGLSPLTCVAFSKQQPGFLEVAINPYFSRYD
jgi:tetratricopeptide (TPR) repeat protein